MLPSSRNVARSRLYPASRSVRNSHVQNSVRHGLLPRSGKPSARVGAVSVFTAAIGACTIVALGAKHDHADYSEVNWDDLEDSPALSRARERSQLVENKLRENYKDNPSERYLNDGIKYGSTIVESEAMSRMGEYYHDYNVDSGFNRRWLSFVICNGYDGVLAANATRKHLPGNVMNDLSSILVQHFNDPENVPYPSPGEILASIRNTFLSVDYSAHTSAQRALRFRDNYAEDALAEEQMGCTALFVAHDVLGGRVYAANAGDGRVLLGRRSAKDGKYDVHVLVSENEPYSNERPKRSFGDAANGSKWNKQQLDALRKQRLDISPPLPADTTSSGGQQQQQQHTSEDMKLTANPVMATTRVKPGDFIIFASRGFWESLTNEEAVGLVGHWLENERKWVHPITKNGNNTNNNHSAKPGKRSHIQKEDLPVRRRLSSNSKGDKVQVDKVQVDNTICHNLWQAPKRFVSHPGDDPCLHLARNALGGADETLAAWLLSTEHPRARQWRKDMALGVLVIDKNPLITAIHQPPDGENTQGESSGGSGTTKFYTGNDDYGQDD